MKTTKNLIVITIFAVISILSSLINSGCGSENIIGSNSNIYETGIDATDSITVEVTRLYGGFEFKLNNNTHGTIINDFHVQFDKKVKITEWSLLWQFDNATTDLNNGKIGEKAGLNQQPIPPGQHRVALWIKVQGEGPFNFNWQATKDGIVVQKGTSKLP